MNMVLATVCLQLYQPSLVEAAEPITQLLPEFGVSFLFSSG
ncbi:hypothetical protein GLYMA_05G147150v4 [Glycine max]|nr:hypothetical protein GLYMA_05G147150v4 [Glycine max]KAH1134441.1 hypothetical protein GYH30_012692 [Glycine max]